MFGTLKDANGQPIAVNRYLAQELYGPAWDPKLGPLQPGLPEHLAYWTEQIDKGNVLLAGPLANFEYAFILFSDQVKTYAEAEAVMEGDPWSKSGQVISTLVFWTSQPLAGNAG